MTNSVKSKAGPGILFVGLALLLGAPTGAIADDGAIARGGRLYDKWFGENKAEKPTGNHLAYPADGKYKDDATWRCKECHGWDYLGKDGAYSSGKHATGIVGIRAAAAVMRQRLPQCCVPRRTVIPKSNSAPRMSRTSRFSLPRVRST